jgi:hypothetical protein
LLLPIKAGLENIPPCVMDGPAMTLVKHAFEAW